MSPCWACSRTLMMRVYFRGLFFDFNDVDGSGDEFPEIRDEFMAVKPCRFILIMDVEHEVVEFICGVIGDFLNIKRVQVFTIRLILPMLQINTTILLLALTPIRMNRDDVREITHFSLLSYPDYRKISFNSRYSNILYSTRR